MTQTTQQAFDVVSEQLRVLMDALMQTHGEVRALRYMLDAILSLHPEPTLLRQVWQQKLPDVTDDLTQSDSAAHAMQRAGWQRTLAHYSVYLDALARQARAPGEDAQ